MRQENHKTASVTSELHFSQGCGRAGNKEKGCIFERIKPPYYSITRNSCCYSFLQENSRRSPYRCMKNNEDILQPCFQGQGQGLGARGNVTVKVWGDEGILETALALLLSAGLFGGTPLLPLSVEGGPLPFARHFLIPHGCVTLPDRGHSR